MRYENSYARIVMREYKKFATDYSGPESEAARAPPPGGRCTTKKSFIDPSSSDSFRRLKRLADLNWLPAMAAETVSERRKKGLELSAKSAYMRNI